VAGGVKGGVGTASTVLESGATVAALVAVNAAGSVLDPATGELYGARFGEPGEFPPPPVAPGAAEPATTSVPAGPGPLNTTLAVVATDATLTRAQAQKLAGTAHDGLARAIRPVHSLSDGDTVFAVSTCARPLIPRTPSAAGADPAFGVHIEAGALNAVLAAGADVLTRAVVHAMLAAESAGGFPCYRELHGPRPARGR
jgi:putative pantetheine hydrolase